MMNFLEKYKEYQTIIDNYFLTETNKLVGEEKLISAMKYSLLSGGKRVRPVLLLALTEILGGDINKALPFCLALECIHTYSLIHDDLPAMDNDDYRRGKLTNHKVYGESFAILAGDALLNLAYEICLNNCNTQKEIKASKYLAEYAGYKGMVLGQAYDLNNNKQFNEETLLIIDKNKTSKLITAPLVIAALLSEKNELPFIELGEKLGLIFQFNDDILDVEGSFEVVGKLLNKDENKGKLTAISIYGLEGAKLQIQKLLNDCKNILSNIDNSEFLVKFAEYIALRKK